jgi:hypothetical protein
LVRRRDELVADARQQAGTDADASREKGTGSPLAAAEPAEVVALQGSPGDFRPIDADLEVGIDAAQAEENGYGHDACLSDLPAGISPERPGIRVAGSRV